MTQFRVILEGVSLVPLPRRSLHRIVKDTLTMLAREPEFRTIQKVIGRISVIDICFCSERKMKTYQWTFRRKKKSTDVLSFPAFESPQNQEQGYLGSLILCPAKIRQNARDYSKDFRSEVREVIVHGLLHLLGFDHEGVSKRKTNRMYKVQAKVLEQLAKVGP